MGGVRAHLSLCVCKHKSGAVAGPTPWRAEHPGSGSRLGDSSAFEGGASRGSGGSVGFCPFPFTSEQGANQAFL